MCDIKMYSSMQNVQCPPSESHKPTKFSRHTHTNAAFSSVVSISWLSQPWLVSNYGRSWIDISEFETLTNAMEVWKSSCVIVFVCTPFPTPYARSVSGQYCERFCQFLTSVYMKVAATRTGADVRTVGSILQVHLSYPDIPPRRPDPLATYFPLIISVSSNKPIIRGKL